MLDMTKINSYYKVAKAAGFRRHGNGESLKENGNAGIP